jgi:hypothetical protein
MRFVSCLISFAFIWLEFSLTSGNNQILCTSRCSPIILSFSQALTLPDDCQEDNDVTEIFDQASVCAVDYRINYAAQQIHLHFHVVNDTDKFDVHTFNQHLHQTVSLGLVNQYNHTDETSRKFLCNTRNDCAREFYMNTIERLIYDGRMKLDQIKSKLHNISLLMDESSRRRCTDSDKTGNKTTVLCRTGLCYARSFHDDANDEHDNKKQKCHLGDRPTLLSDIEYHLASSKLNRKELLEFRCNKNVCNRNDMIDIIQGIINEYTHWNATEHDLDDIETKQMSSLSTRSYLSMSMFAVFLLLIQFVF